MYVNIVNIPVKVVIQDIAIVAILILLILALMSKMTDEERKLLSQTITILDTSKEPMEISLYSFLFYNDLIANIIPQEI